MCRALGLGLRLGGRCRFTVSAVVMAVLLTAGAALGQNMGNIKGTGSSTDPYIIADSTDMERFKGLVMDATNASNNATWPVSEGKYWALGGSFGWYNHASNVVSGTAWCIGGPYRPFRGHFDGRGHTITMGRLDGGNGSYVAFFGTTENATIKNLNISGRYIHGGTHSGWLIGEAVRNTNIENVHITMSDTSKSNNAYWGGVIGNTWEFNNSTLNIKNTSVTGAAQFFSSSAYNADAGGLIGALRRNTGTQQSNVNIVDCMADVKFVGSTSNATIGGIIGWVNQYNTVNMTRVVAINDIGGLGSSNRGSIVGGIDRGSKVNFFGVYTNQTGLNHIVGGTHNGGTWEAASGSRNAGISWGVGGVGMSNVYTNLERRSNSYSKIADDTRGNG